jgi:hypothetical protein
MAPSGGGPASGLGALVLARLAEGLPGGVASRPRLPARCLACQGGLVGEAVWARHWRAAWSVLPSQTPSTLCLQARLAGREEELALARAEAAAKAAEAEEQVGAGRGHVLSARMPPAIVYMQPTHLTTTSPDPVVRPAAAAAGQGARGAARAARDRAVRV